MKKYNVYTLIALCLMMIAALIYDSYQDTSPLFVLVNTQVKEDNNEIVKVDDIIEDEDEQGEIVDDKQEPIQVEVSDKKEETSDEQEGASTSKPPKQDESVKKDEVEVSPPKEEKKDEVKKDDVVEDNPVSEPIVNESVVNAPLTNVDDMLFIGDSRTVGIQSYAGLEGADFFCSVGMSVFNINDQSCNINGLGNVTLDSLLASKQYNKIHVMLGINEIGYNLNRVKDEYSALINKVVEKQPNAKVFIGANLHVTKQYSDSQKYINNDRINKLNKKIKALCNDQNIIFIDTNVYFDDDNYALGNDKTSDNVHLYAKYYKEWSEWIRKEISVKLG